MALFLNSKCLFIFLRYGTIQTKIMNKNIIQDRRAKEYILKLYKCIYSDEYMSCLRKS